MSTPQEGLQQKRLERKKNNGITGKELTECASIVGLLRLRSEALEVRDPRITLLFDLLVERVQGALPRPGREDVGYSDVGRGSHDDDGGGGGEWMSGYRSGGEAR